MPISGEICTYCRTRAAVPGAAKLSLLSPLPFWLLFKRDAYCLECAEKINESSRLAGILVLIAMLIFGAFMIISMVTSG